LVKSPSRLRHANEITEYDLEHFQLYMNLFDMKKDGKSWAEIENIIWPGGKPADFKKYLKDHHKRAQWMTLTGYKIMMRDNPMSKEDSLNMLVEKGRMKPEERAFLQSKAGAKFWPKRTKH